ncbi:hypothetical protein N9D22_06620 [Flavobacteriaceae bacterium]|jgi:hypothetical protein|nr:hypothetical protein [Flavobacteriaceae bacterium]
MATTTSITTTYAGESAGKYISAALLSGNTIANGGLTIRPNVKFKEVVKRLELDGITKNGTCDFNDTSTLTLTERILEPKELQVNLELCKKDFRSDWDAIQMGYSAFDNLPSSFQDYLISYVAAKVAQKNEQNIWAGADGEGSFDGFSTLLAADAALPAAQQIAGTTVTAANVIDELGKVVDQIPSALYGRDDLFIYVSQNIFRAYKRALGGFQSGGQGAAGVGSQGNNQDINILYFDGVKIFMANGLAANTAVATTKDNLQFGTGLLSDHQEVKVLDMADLDGSQNVRIIMRFTAGVQYGVVEDIVTYGI